MSKKFLIVGNIIHGIKNPPKNFTLLDHLKNINDFYKSIKYLIVPNPNQTGVSTKIIESLNYNCPVLTTSSMTKMLNIDLYDIEINNINDLATYYKGLNYEFILKKQIHAFENYKSTVKKEEKEIINHLNNSSIYNSS